MSEHLTQQQIEQYASRKPGTSAAELLDVDEHLSGCAECRTKALTASGLSPASISILPSDSEESDHLEHEQLAAYVDGTLGDVDKEIVEGHLEFCPSCVAEVAELRSFRSMLAKTPEKAYSPDPSAGIFQRMDSTTRVRRPSFRFAPAFAMAATILIVAVVVFHGHGAGSPKHAQVAEATQPGGSAVTPPPSIPPVPAPPVTPPTVAPTPPPTTEPASPVQPKEEKNESTVAPTRSTRQLPMAAPIVQRPSRPVAGPSTLMDNIGAARPAAQQMAKVGPTPSSATSESTSPVAPPPTSTAAASAPSANDTMAAAGAVHQDEKVAAQPGGFGGGMFNGSVENGIKNRFATPPVVNVPNSTYRSDGIVGMNSLAAGRTAELPASVKNVLTSGHLDLDTPEIRDLTAVNADSNIGVAPAPFNVSSPVGTALLSDRPTFTWEQDKDASSYQVTITDRDGNAIATSPSISSTAWKADKPLPTGQVLKWQVKATANGTSAGTAPNGGARFRVLDPDRAAQIKDAQKTFADQPLALGILYAQAGMLDEAQIALEKAHKQDPQNEIVPKLLADVKAVRDNSASL